jgi:type I pantothenate kinase
MLKTHISLTRTEWKKFISNSAMPNSIVQAKEKKGFTFISSTEWDEIYVPLTQFLHFQISHYQQTLQFLHSLHTKKQQTIPPYIIGIIGSVSAGKTTTAKILQYLLSNHTNHLRTAFVSTDHFLFPNQYLEQHGWLYQKGFPHTYDAKLLIEFLQNIKAGKPKVKIPIYSHDYYDILPNQKQELDQPDILILEGINLLQSPTHDSKISTAYMDYLDFTIYIDADEQDLLQWFITRFEHLRLQSQNDPQSFYRQFLHLSASEAVQLATQTWNQINGVNLKKYILPTKPRAKLILKKNSLHQITEIQIRKW